MASQEAQRIPVPMEHEEWRSQHDPAVLYERANFLQGLNFCFKPAFA
jgi:hypothetical protein